MNVREEQLLEYAAVGNLKAVLALVNQGVNINYSNKVNGWTALHWASKRGKTNIVQFLLKMGANKDLKDSKGKIPADYATSQEIKKLLDAENMISEPESTISFTPNYLANPDYDKLWGLPENIPPTLNNFNEAFILNNKSDDSREIIKNSRTTTTEIYDTNKNDLASAKPHEIPVVNGNTLKHAVKNGAENHSEEIVHYSKTRKISASKDSEKLIEILVYLSTMEKIEGAIYVAPNENLSKIVDIVLEEISIPGKKVQIYKRSSKGFTIPIHQKQYYLNMDQIIDFELKEEMFAILK